MGSFVENVNKLATNMPVNGWASFDEKVDKVIGKQLSSEDYTLTEKNKLAGIAIQATQNSSDAVLLNRGNHTRTQSIDTIEESDTLKILTAAEREKLDAISPHPSKHPVNIIDGSLNPAKFIKTDAVGNTGFHDVTWSDIQGKPSSYNPNAHQHSLSDLSDAILKADKTYVDTQLATKVDTNTLTTELSKKADANTVATDAELQAAVATLQPLSQKGQANGYVPLDSAGKIPNSYLNNLSTIEVFTANSQANMLLLSNVSVGDQCIRTDLVSNNLFILIQTPATDIVNWKQINSSASVISVNGQTGVVNVSKTDVGLGNVDNTADVNKAVLSATKLATARTISLKSDVTGSASFDGSGNVSITATVADNSHNHTLANISDFPSTVSATELGYLDGVTSAIQTQLNAKQDALTSGTNIKTINGSTILGSGNLTIVGGDMMKSTYDTTANGIVDRAETADKLTNARTINGTSFDGSANVNIEERLGTAIASAATTTIGTAGLGETIHITGTTAITSLGVSTTGARRTLVFDAALVLTYNATSLILPTSANITTAAGDTAEFVCENGASGYWRCVDFQRLNGYPLTLGNLSTTGNSATATNANNLGGNPPSYYQQALGFTPIQQGGGAGQSTNKIYIGWGNNSLRCQIDGTDFGTTFPMNINGNAASATSAGSCTGNSATATTATTATTLTTFVAGGLTEVGRYFDFHGSTAASDYDVRLDAGVTGTTGGGTLTITAGGGLVCSGNVTAYSDSRLKENIETIDNALEKTLNMRGVYYNRIDDEKKRRKLGVIAQEVQAIIPEVVLTNEETGTLSVDYGNIVGLLIEAIKEQQKQIDELKALAKGA